MLEVNPSLLWNLKFYEDELEVKMLDELESTFIAPFTWAIRWERISNGGARE